MKRLRVYWRKSPDDLDVLQAVDHIRFGPDGEEVITTSQGAQTVVAMAREFADDFWVEDVREIDPSQAADLLLASSPGESVGLLRRLLALVAQEDPGAAESLFEELEDHLKEFGRER